MYAALIAIAIAAHSSRSLPAPEIGPDSALKACTDAHLDSDAGKSAAANAEDYYRTRLAQKPDETRIKTLLARTLSQCVMRHSSIWSKEGIVKESIKLLHEVLASDSTDWEARYGLALDYYYAPAFFGWTDNAIREFEHLLAQQGEQNTFAEQAGTYLYLGLLYEKKGRHADARTVWQRGSRLFPNDTRLRERAGTGL